LSVGDVAYEVERVQILIDLVSEWLGAPSLSLELVDNRLLAVGGLLTADKYIKRGKKVKYCLPRVFCQALCDRCPIGDEVLHLLRDNRGNAQRVSPRNDYGLA
jgi:hypothetical protein